MRKEKYKANRCLDLLAGAMLGLFLLLILMAVLDIGFKGIKQNQDNWQCVEWKNETDYVERDIGYLSHLKWIADWSGSNDTIKKCQDKDGIVHFEGIYYSNDDVFIYQFECFPPYEKVINQVCVKEGNCKEKYLVECYAPFDIELFAGYDRATNYCMSPFKLTTYKICKEYRDLKW